MLTIDNLDKSYKSNGSTTKVFHQFSLNVPENSIFALFGPNGCGKTTLLDMIAGFSTPDNGVISLNGKAIDRNQISLIIQDYRAALIPWINVEKNIALPLRIAGVNPRTQHQEVLKICRRFKFTGDLKAYPYELSGGQQQFISIMRALIVKPKILLMDEPFSSLDYSTTLPLQIKIANILHQTKTTTIFVSHDIDSTLLFSNQIALLSKKPTRIVETHSNKLKYPRSSAQIGSLAFNRLKRSILNRYVGQAEHKSSLTNKYKIEVGGNI